MDSCEFPPPYPAIASSPLRSICRSRRAITWARHWARLTIRGAKPAGCRNNRNTLTGGRSSKGSAPATKWATARFAESMVQCRSTTRAGQGSCAASTVSIARRRMSSTGAWNACPSTAGQIQRRSSSAFFSRKGMSRHAAKWSSVPRLGFNRPVSIRPSRLEEISASEAKSSWLIRRLRRHSRNRPPTSWAGAWVVNLRLSFPVGLAWCKYISVQCPTARLRPIQITVRGWSQTREYHVASREFEEDCRLITPLVFVEPVLAAAD